MQRRIEDLRGQGYPVRNAHFSLRTKSGGVKQKGRRFMETGSPEAEKQSHAIFRECQRGVAASFPVCIGIVPFALVLGAAAAQKGLAPFEVLFLTGLNFAGGSEFAAIQVWSNPPRVLLITFLTFLVNSRHLVMGATLAPFLERYPKKKVLPALFFMCDESWALGYEDANRRVSRGIRNAFSMSFYLGASLCLYGTWAGCTTAGAIAGPVLGDVRVYGVDMAIPAVFLVLLKGQWPGFKAAGPWAVSLAAAAAAYLFIPGSWHILSGTVAGLIAAYIMGGRDARLV